MSEDVLERAKALRETALPRRICSIPGQTGYGNPSLNKGWDFSAVDELVRVVVPELITEVERLRSVISEPVKSFGTMELVSWVNQLQKTISEYPDAEWGNWPFVLMMGVHCENFSKRWHSPTIELMAARIKELEADRIEARAQYLLFMNDNPGCIAWNFDELDETEQDALREQARYMLELEEPWAYIQLREAREQIKRLEAAFLKSETERKFYTTINGMNSEFDWNGYPECPQNGIHKEWFRQQARDVLERIRKGELREAAINKLLSMKKLEVIEQIKEEIRSGKDDRSLSEVGLR